MNNDNKLLLLDRIVDLVKQGLSSEEIPILVGALNTAQGIVGFEVCGIGHPVFEYKDRYILYSRSSNELKERVFNPVSKQHETKIGYFMVAISYYKEDLAPAIDFGSIKKMVTRLILRQ